MSISIDNFKVLSFFVILSFNFNFDEAEICVVLTLVSAKSMVYITWIFVKVCFFKYLLSIKRFIQNFKHLFFFSTKLQCSL